MISVVIPAFNEEKILASCLESFLYQTTTTPFEIIVVDNGSTDKTREIAENFKKKLPLRIISELHKGRGPARAAGFHAAKGTIIFSTDADSIVPPDWIESLSGYFTDPNIIAVTGTGKIMDSTRFKNAMVSFLQPFSMSVYKLLFRHFWLTGFNFAIRKTIYEKSGGFNKLLNIQEDTDLAVRVRNFGKIVFVKNTPVIMSGRRFEKGITRGLFAYLPSFIAFNIFRNEKKASLSDVR